MMDGILILATALTVEQAMGQLHAMFVNFPIIFFTAALIADLFSYFGKKNALIAGHWLMIIGVVTCIPAIVTGLAAAIGFEPMNGFLEEHRYLGIATGISSSLYAGLRISAMLWSLPLKPLHYVFFSVMLVALVSWTSDYGGLITRGELPIDTHFSITDNPMAL